MIYLITGAPGSGKTLYAVSTLIKKLAAEKLKDKKGADLKRRILIDGIPDLLVPHELLCPMVEDEKGGWSSDGQGVDTWPDWVQPGDVIVIDEVQRYWRPRGMGSKPPRMIKELETHRHKGCDFVIITQDPMLIDQNVRRLIGRHMHVRRMFGLARAVIYDWDSCSMNVARVKGAAKTLWNYPKSAYKLYSSSMLHTKQRQKIPAWVAVPVLAIVGGFFVAPQAFGVMNSAMSGKGITQSKVEPVPVKPAITASSISPVMASAPVPAASSVALAASPLHVGCIRAAGRCGCFGDKGERVETTPEFCLTHVGADRGKPLEFPDSPFPDLPLDRSERDSLAFAFNPGRVSPSMSLAMR